MIATLLRLLHDLTFPAQAVTRVSRLANHVANITLRYWVLRYHHGYHGVGNLQELSAAPAPPLTRREQMRCVACR